MDIAFDGMGLSHTHLQSIVAGMLCNVRAHKHRGIIGATTFRLFIGTEGGGKVGARRRLHREAHKPTK